MHDNGMIITNQFISHRNYKLLRGSVSRAHIHVCYIFLKSNEEIMVRNQTSSYIFIIYSLVSCSCVILQFIHISHLSKSLGSIPSLRGFKGARTISSDSALMHDNVCIICQSACWLSLYNVITMQRVHHS